MRSYRTLSPLPGPEGPGGLLSVALSLGSPPAGVTRRLFAMEPGLSSPFLAKEGDRPAVWSHFRVAAGAREIKSWAASLSQLARSNAISRARVSPSATPSISCGRQCRWKAVTMVEVRASNSPEGAQS